MVPSDGKICETQQKPFVWGRGKPILIDQYTPMLARKATGMLQQPNVNGKPSDLLIFYIARCRNHFHLEPPTDG